MVGYHEGQVGQVTDGSGSTIVVGVARKIERTPDGRIERGPMFAAIDTDHGVQLTDPATVRDLGDMLRRAERGVGVAIRKGQEQGAIATKAEMAHDAGLARQQLLNKESLKPRPSDFVGDSQELTQNGAGIYHMADGVSDDQFEEALTEAEAEGNLSRLRPARARTLDDCPACGPVRRSKPRNRPQAARTTLAATEDGRTQHSP